MKTIPEAVAMKAKLEAQILGLIQEFEHLTGCRIERVNLMHMETFAGRNTKSAKAVEIEVRL